MNENQNNNGGNRPKLGEVASAASIGVSLVTIFATVSSLVQANKKQAAQAEFDKIYAEREDAEYKLRISNYETTIQRNVLEIAKLKKEWKEKYPNEDIDEYIKKNL